MKTSFIALFSFALLLSCEWAENIANNKLNEENMKSTQSTSSFKGRSIVFYNVENLFDTENNPRTNDDDFTPFGEYRWDEERYEKKLNRLSEAINLIKEKPILIGLSEVENYKVIEDLIETSEMTDVNYKYVHFDSPDRRGIDVALLYDQDAFEVLESKKIPVTLKNNRNFKTRDILYVHGKLSNEIEAHVFVNHWSSRREGQKESEHKRVRAASILREKIDAILAKNEDANIIILGDFNDYPTNKSLQTVLRAKEAGYEKEGDLINLLFDEHQNDEGTAVHQREWSVLDQIIISQAIYDHKSGLGIKNQDAEILRENKLIFTYKDGGQKPSATYGGRKYYGGYSDHLPVYIVLK
ncbi:MAG: endonuclease [Fluviicola sp.]|nr:endonuclease [Fluviicola sp.]